MAAISQSNRSGSCAGSDGDSDDGRPTSSPDGPEFTLMGKELKSNLNLKQNIFMHISRNDGGRELKKRSRVDWNLTSPLGDLQVAGAQVLLHVLLEGLLEELLPLLQLHLGGLDPRLLGTRHPLRMVGLQLHWMEETQAGRS